MQLGFFTSENTEKINIEGLHYIENFIPDNLQKRLLIEIDKESWILDLKRRVQHYGYKYDYKKRGIDLSMKVGDLPNWTDEVISRFLDKKIIDFKPDQLIVNEYLPGQGISPHIDCEPCFSDTIISLSLGSGCQMDFENGSKKTALYLKPGSIVVLSDEARYKWTHGIPGRKSDIFMGNKINRMRRVSLTFRKVILS